MSYLKYYTPKNMDPVTYRALRQSSLNFETCGGERYSSSDATLEPTATMYHFRAKDVELAVTSHRAEEGVGDELPPALPVRRERPRHVSRCAPVQSQL